MNKKIIEQKLKERGHSNPTTGLKNINLSYDPDDWEEPDSIYREGASDIDNLIEALKSFLKDPSSAEHGNYYVNDWLDDLDPEKAMRSIPRMIQMLKPLQSKIRSKRPPYPIMNELMRISRLPGLNGGPDWNEVFESVIDELNDSGPPMRFSGIDEIW
jgi:hypothetical protein